jgi:hypothetical protein
MGAGEVWAQVNDSSSLTVKFLKPSVQIEENAFQFNSCAITNNTGKDINFTINLVVPGYINLISHVPSGDVALAAGETYYLPLRFNANLDSQSVESDKLLLTVRTVQGKTAGDAFDIAIKPFYRWRIGLRQPDIVVDDNTSRYNIAFFIENLGNVTDEFELSIESSSNISLVKKPEKILLKSGEYRVVDVEAIVRFTNADLNSSLNLYVRNKKGEKKFLLQKFTRIGSEFSQKVYSRARLPMVLELNAQNIGTGQAFYSAGLYGNIELPKERKLNVFFISDNYYKDFRSKSAMGFMSYQTKRDKISIGNIQDYKQFFIVGNGFEFRHISRNQGLYRISAIKSRLEAARLFSFSTEQVVAKNLYFFSDNFVHIDKGRETNSYLSMGSLKWNINRFTSAAFITGGGMESIRKEKFNFDTSLHGGMVGYEFDIRRKAWSGRSRIHYYSKNIPGFNKGSAYHLHELKKPFKQNSVAVFYEVNKKIYNQSYDSLVKLLFNVSNTETGVRGAIMKNNFSINTTISSYKQQQDSASSPVANMMRFSVNLNWMLSNAVTVSLYTNTGRVSVPEMPGVKPYLAFANFGSVQYKQVGVQFRWDYQPFSYFEIKQYAHVPDSFRLLQVMPYAEKKFTKFNTTYRLTMNYTSDKALGYEFMLFSNQLTYFDQDKGLELSLLGQLNTSDRKNSFINLKLRKNLAVPAYKVRESHSFNLILFKDHNGNDVLDEGDEVIPGAEILVNSILVNSDKQGVVQFRNVGDQTYEVDFSKIRNARGWMPKAGFKQTISILAKEKKIFIPFRESRSIKGSIKLIADEKSSKRMSLSHIRVTATDQKGAVYSTLTDVNNEFFFDLPAGVYIVMINHGVFDDEFRPAEISKQVDLVNNNTMEIVFEVRQRKRQINIKHDDDDDDEEED